MDEGSSNSRQRAITLVREALQSCESGNAGPGKTERARRTMQWRLLSEKRPRAFVEQSPVSVYIDQLHEISLADLSREIQAMSSAAALDEVARLQPPTEAERERGEEALGPLEGRIDEH
jgi:hypothetical protein